MRKVLWDPTSVGYLIRTGFTMRRYYHQSGVEKRPDDTVVVESLPHSYSDEVLDPIYRLEQQDADWEAKAHRVTRPDVPIPESIEDLIPDPIKVYEVRRKGVPYKVNECNFITRVALSSHFLSD